ncbi:leucine-rich repeat-containing protein 59 [Trichogramma pretiosum]|uniref:leucine-rich repeat-containing protein 59 n=1 Tax=Trichogramma pretiosum TaxID=7493 RepID=UPI0006C97134|nr:leucine-rich repeat-containing protein 59 [Trichogramma pretiosum]
MPGKLSAKDIKDKLFDDNLDLSLCELEDVPVREIAIARRFSILDLSNNYLTTLPPNFATLAQIVKLDLSKNQLTELPENFGDLKQLRHLDLYGNQISRLPLSLGQLKKLKWLDLKENPLTPSVASIAGPCNNPKECQDCARNVVKYLANVAVTIEEEKLRRLTAAQESEKVVVTTEKKHKKKKHKKKNADKDKIINEGDEVSAQDDKDNGLVKETSLNEFHNNNNFSIGGTCYSLCQIFYQAVLLSIVIMLLAVLFVAVFPVYNYEKSEEFFTYVEKHFDFPLKGIRHEIIKLAKAFPVIMEDWINTAILYLKELYNRYFNHTGKLLPDGYKLV